MISVVIKNLFTQVSCPRNVVLKYFDNVIIPEDVTQCWDWCGVKTYRNYGRILIRKSDGLYKNYMAHRISYEIHIGPIPAGLIIMHSCDNPPCSNPKHLIAGTKFENTKDCISKGRPYGRPKGKKNQSSGKL